MCEWMNEQVSMTWSGWRGDLEEVRRSQDTTQALGRSPCGVGSSELTKENSPLEQRWAVTLGRREGQDTEVLGSQSGLIFML